VVGDKVERCERKEVIGSGLLECATERVELRIWDDFCIYRSAVCRHFDHVGRAAIGRII